MIELNISCPNVKSGGMAFGIQSDVAYEVVSKVRKICDKPLMVKLSPNAENICNMASSAVEIPPNPITGMSTVLATS